jgi:protoheme IX farnesyltransferase
VAAVVIFFIGCLMFYAVKLYKLRTAKAAKALMLVSVGYITLLSYARKTAQTSDNFLSRYYES